MQIQLFLTLALLCFASIACSQDELQAGDTLNQSGLTEKKNIDKDDDVGVLYRYEMSVSLLAHSNGFGLNVRKGKHVTGYKKKMWEIEFVSMKHPKEYKSYHTSENGKGYFFGKQYSFLVLRPGLGKQKVISSKIGKRGVEIRYLYFGGLSIGFLKPVYLEIIIEGPTGEQSVVTEKYDPQNHREPEIYGKASSFKGVTEMKLVPGIYGKFGLNFEYSALDDRIRALETGIAFDLYYYWKEKGGKVPIMAKINPNDDYDPNKSYFLTFYVSLHFGKKWN